MTTAEELALAVLRGDMSAVAPLCDKIMEDSSGLTYAPLPPVTTIDRGRLRAVLTAPEGMTMTPENIEQALQVVVRWLNPDPNSPDSRYPLILPHGARLELYSLPEG